MKRILSTGGGLDSFAMLVGAIDRGEIPDLAIFADTGSPRGDDGEWPATYRHLRDYTMRLCEERGIEFVWIMTDDYPIRGRESLLAYFEATKTIPTRMSRMCTMAAKVERIDNWIKDHLAGEKLEIWIGFEAGEEQRAAKDPHASKSCGDGLWRTNRFPLMEWGYCRCRCEVLVRRAGFPVPRKSACIYCPFSRRGDFITLSQEQPDAFQRISEWESVSGVTKAGRKLFIVGEGPLAQDVKKPYNPRTIKCQVCGRNPRASKATGSDYLQPAEYVPLEEPVAAPGSPAPNPSRALRLKIAGIESAIVPWLTARLINTAAALAVIDGAELELNEADVPAAVEALRYYEQLAIVDQDLQPDGAAAARSLSAKISAAV